MVYHKNKKFRKNGAGPKRQREENDNDEPNITFEFASPVSLAKSYSEAIQSWNDVNELNAEKKNVITLNRRLFILLIVLGLLAYFQPHYEMGLAGEALKAAQTQALQKLVSEGLSYDVVMQKMEYFNNSVTQMRFSFGNGQMLTALEILELLKQNSTLEPLISSMERLFNTLKGTYSEVAGLASASYGFFENLSQGNINRKNIGDVVGYGIWSVVFFVGYTVTKTTVDITRGVASTVSSIGKKFTSGMQSDEVSTYIGVSREEKGLNTLLHMRVNNEEKIVTLNEIISTISNRPKDIVSSFFDTMLSKLFYHNEEWTISTDEDKSMISSELSTILTTQSNESLSTVSDNGYGGEFGRMAQYISDNYGVNLELAKDYILAGFTNIYKPLLKFSCGGKSDNTKVGSQSSSSQMSLMSPYNSQQYNYNYDDENISSSNVQSSQMSYEGSQLSGVTMENCMYYNDTEIEKNTNEAVYNTVTKNTNNNNIIQNARMTLRSSKNKSGGKRNNRTKKHNKRTKKNKSKYNKSKKRYRK